MSDEIEVRTVVKEDLNFVLATWLRSYRHASQFAKKISNEIYFKWHHKVIERIIERGGNILIAHPVGEPNVILGYLCIENQSMLPVVHYCYVKKTFRKMGVAKALLDGSTLEGAHFTHYTTDCDWITKKFKLVYDPYLI